MGNISNGMESICQGIMNSSAERKKDLEDLKNQTETIRDNAKKFIGDCKKSHKEMAKNLKEDLSKNREGLIKDVGLLRKDFQKSQKAVRSDIEGASKNWNEMNETLRGKKAK
ncbi:MAG: hypothetical protein Q8O13_10790 [Candidatus Omnitrophota bacterium]|nr:hypothetical protein [Candidatus Omnitrophota bacterium]